jgi:hypothetical protein
MYVVRRLKVNPLTGQMKYLYLQWEIYSVEERDHQHLEMRSHEERQQMLVIQSQRTAQHAH